MNEGKATSVFTVDASYTVQNLNEIINFQTSDVYS